MINLVVALPAEARPLINHYGLNDKQTHDAGRFRTRQGVCGSGHGMATGTHTRKAA